MAVHVQDTLEFLEDISSHELHVVVFDTAPHEEDVVHAVIKMLAPGGLIICRLDGSEGSDSVDLYELFRRESSLFSARLDGRLLIAARRPQIAKSARRGARRMRRRRTVQNTEGI